MNPSVDPNEAAAKAARDLARVEGKVDAAREMLVRLLKDLVVADRRLSERGATLPPLTWMGGPVPEYEFAMAEHERRHIQLREANEQLLLAALGAQELQAAAEQARRRQTDFLAVVAKELRISPQALADIFDPLAQDSRANGGNGVGPGIVLTVVRALVEAHGGTVTASTEDSGSSNRFVVTLPPMEDSPLSEAKPSIGDGSDHSH